MDILWSLVFIHYITLLFFSCCLFSYGVGLVKSWLVRQIFPVHQTGCPVKSGKLSFVCLFDLILYVPSTISQLNRDGSSWVEPVLS